MDLERAWMAVIFAKNDYASAFGDGRDATEEALALDAAIVAVAKAVARDVQRRCGEEEGDPDYFDWILDEEFTEIDRLFAAGGRS